MLEQAPKATSPRFMIFVPNAVPHFVLVSLENPGWLVRDYSSGYGRLLPVVALGRPIEKILGEPRPEGCLAFRAPRVSTSYQRFWKCLTDELGERFLGAPPALSEPDTDLYPLLEKPEFKKASTELSPLEVERIAGSSRSTDWISWNVIQLLLAERQTHWWHGLSEAVARSNPANSFESASPPKIEFWKTTLSSEAYDKWRRTQMRPKPKPRHPIEGPEEIEIKPVDPPARIDLRFESDHFLIFAETRVRQALSEPSQHDPRRSRIIRLADCLLTAAAGRPCALWLFAGDCSSDRDYVQLVERYRSSPQMFAAELPYHPAETLYQLAGRLTVVGWADLAGTSLLRRVSDDPVTERVRKELRRRVTFEAQVAKVVAAASA